MKLLLAWHPLERHREAEKALCSGDARLFLGLAQSNTCWLEIVEANALSLQEYGIFEVALRYALTGTRTNNRHFTACRMLDLIKRADRQKLRAAGAPLPGPGPFTLYRGVAGGGSQRHVRGVSWTASLEKARWFGKRFGLPNPAVYRAVVLEQDILAYCNERREQEFLVRLRPHLRPTLIERL